MATTTPPRVLVIGLDGSADVESVVRSALQAHSWECVTVGGGLRHSDDHASFSSASWT